MQPNSGTDKLASALIGALVVIIGWFINDRFRKKEEKRKRQSDFIERQIVELYAPLYFMAQSEYRYRKTRDKLVSSHHGDQHHKIWLAYSEEFIVPLQKRIYELLQTKWHLLEHSKVHKSIENVIEHCTTALSLYRLDREGINISTEPAEPMPNDFHADIKRDLDDLRERYEGLRGIRIK